MVNPLAIIIIITVLFSSSGDVRQATALHNNELNGIVKKTEAGFPVLWKMKEKLKESLTAADGDRDVVKKKMKKQKPTEIMREKALEKLLEVLGVAEKLRLPHIYKLNERKQMDLVPPLFMTELYKEIADPYNGLSRGKNKPFGADVIRSYFERGNPNSDFLIFDISGLASWEHVVEAEIHLYRKLSSSSFQHHGSREGQSFPPYYLVRVYQAMSNDPSLPVDSHRLLSAQHVSEVSSPGWHVLNVREAVLDWIKGNRPNLGLIVTVSSPLEPESGRETRHIDALARRNERDHRMLQPILVLFNVEGDKGIRLPRHPIRGYPNFYRRVDYPSEDDNHTVHSDQRKANGPKTESNAIHKYLKRVSNDTLSSPRKCVRKSLLLDLIDIGWGSWIMAPMVIEGYRCVGRCEFPMAHGQNPTNHATVQSIIHELGLVEGVRKPCCVPTRLGSLTVLYLNDGGNVALKTIDDMVVKSCGCR